MFAHSFFPAAFFAPVYYPPAGFIPPPPTPGPDLDGKPWLRRPRANDDQELLAIIRAVLPYLDP